MGGFLSTKKSREVRRKRFLFVAYCPQLKEREVFSIKMEEDLVDQWREWWLENHPEYKSLSSQAVNQEEQKE